MATGDVHRDGELLHGRTGDEVEHLVVPILHMGGCVICGEAVLVIRAVDAGERHGIAGVLGRDADEGALGHAAADGQCLAGGQIYIVGRTGDGVVSHSGRTAELQLTGILGVDINSAAAAASRIAFNRTAGEITD